MADGGTGALWLGLSKSGGQLVSGCLGCDMAAAAAASGSGRCGILAKRHMCAGDHQAWTGRRQRRFNRVALPFLVNFNKCIIRL